jgi:hypothetical protein
MADLVSREGLFLPCPLLITSSHGREQGVRKQVFSYLFIKALIPFLRALPS